MKTARILILSFIFTAFYSLEVNAQKCKFDIEETDEFSGESKLGFRYWSNIPNGLLNYYFIKENNEYKIRLDLQRGGILKDDILKDKSTFMFKLEDGSMITAKCDDDAIPTANIYTGNTGYKVFYSLTKDDIIKISNSMPVALKLTAIPDIDYSDDIKSRKGGKMSEEISCFLK